VEAHEPQPPLLDAVMDIFFLTLGFLHLGQQGFSFALKETSASNSFPHFLHEYS
jgi:hypothetical protein